MSDAQAETPIEVRLPSSVTAESSVEVTQVTVTLSKPASTFTMDVKGYTERPEGVGAVALTDDVPLYLEIEGDETMNRSLDAATVDFSLAKDDLSARGTTPENVAFYRYHNGTWEQLDTKLKETNTQSQYLMQATSPGTSYFALGIQHPVATVSNVTTEPGIVTGETTTVTADVTNTGHVDGVVTVNLTVDGEIVSNQSVTLQSGDTQSVTFDHQFDTAGSHTVALNGERVDTVVREQSTAVLTDLTVDASTIGPGESVTLIATVTNTGEGEETTTLTFEGVDSVTESRTVTVPAGQREVVTFEQTIESPGEYTLRVNDRVVDVTVKEGSSKFGTPPTDSAGESDAGATDDPGYSLLVVLGLAVASISLAVSFRRLVEKRK
ncbi:MULTISPECIES: PGF-pre-PGF domain-containing protein [Haloferax]|uniref:Cell surface glycoprotein related protein n=1 Tax=Haloferax mediterranei (strain ATCC 33500 / DSM 1411 / JCM 8866 / NBRC 14739 / NCIMB 2177 / R-4) TaxID=523841 RepID=M0IWD0_HALMT|nr:PGF-pre-PGF domain-containing protein [Haloferax mediterranei]ELZ99789.1 cell surface glycoprotein related protein [Haloferax mediterranei ATCC 33500]MDX5987427.1 PGF-pre-PGF domain-containing protein [Haloferax mediterranei ATCC 33500]